MDRNRFDDMTRALGSGMPRRMAMKTIAGVLVGGWMNARRRDAGAAEEEPIRPTRPPLRCAAGKQCGDVCCGENETCVGLNLPGDIGGGSGDPNDLLQCVCQHDYVRDQTGTCVCPRERTCGASCCGDGETCCDGECVDTGWSNSNCGACGHACEDDRVCQHGTCVCSPETLDCGGFCVPKELPNGRKGCCSDLDCDHAGQNGGDLGFCCTAGPGEYHPCGSSSADGCGPYRYTCTVCL